MTTNSDKYRGVTGTFQYLHDNPEVSWEEFGTTDYIRGLFEGRDDCRITTFEGSPGLVIEIGQGKPVIGLRADMDALWQEVDGKFQANHSCGHDAHMTIVIGTLWRLLENGYPDKGTFRFIFQPAEEKGTGALAYVEKGIVDDVEYLYGMHLRPIQELRYGQFAPAIQHGAARFLQGTIRGEDAHGARPHLNANAIQVGSELVQQLNNIHMDPMVPYSVKMTSFHAGGESSNIIPGNGTFSLDVRAQTNEVMAALTEKIEDIVNMLSAYHGVEIKLEIGANIAAAVINEEAIEIMEEAIIQTAGEAKLAPMITTTGGDDFHFYTIKRPNIKATMLAIGCDLEPGLHHPTMTFNHQAIPEAINVLTRALIHTAEKN
ncbi:amidohydrolase [Ornithinibacillus sp. L9]|uniref:Amidohydrolase n=1 Tax=Ornithinibacillus caprae TaxID=2678566 RepID=A0A6N8FK40_9BACI|nr:M20 peptidase aminoacylase family protein [Ornithinibacillus caprae]MUK87668.1 amidohydrolase [Ornithinibacillus caprae]